MFAGARSAAVEARCNHTFTVAEVRKAGGSDEVVSGLEQLRRDRERLERRQSQNQRAAFRLTPRIEPGEQLACLMFEYGNRRLRPQYEINPQWGSDNV